MTNDDMIFSYASEFKTAIERARDTGMFSKDFSFYKFPKACCGDTCYHCRQATDTGYNYGYIWNNSVATGFIDRRNQCRKKCLYAHDVY